MQTFEEALRDGRNEFIFRTQAEEHLLAVGGQHVFAVDYHPVEAAPASICAPCALNSLQRYCAPIMCLPVRLVGPEREGFLALRPV
jgi:hypothetical protein